ncbi:MAG: hypothetical protein ACI82A_000373 [Candidatus Azotimanducaceae bacterium]|jgi:hypothetical protein
MFRLIILMTLTVASLGATSAASAQSTVFKSRDAQGNTVFSDQASDEAEEIVIEAPQTFKAQPPSRPLKPAKPETVVKLGPAYKSLRIVSPEHDIAVRDNAGNLIVKFALDPALQANHSLQLIVDGELHSEKKSAGPISLTNLDRGTHELQAQIVEDDSGEILQSSNPVSTTILRVSVIPRAN